MKIRINKKHLKNGCIFTFNHSFFNGKKESITLKPILSELDNHIMFYILEFQSQWGNYFRYFDDYKSARKWITSQSKDW
jgi:hypothetical protein